MSEIEQRWSESNADLVAEIRDEILANGPIRFARFMDLALYHDPHGYYRSSQPRPGRTGDFLTAPEAHPIFGATLAAQIVDFDEILRHPPEFTIVEYGAGSGLLIRPLLSELRQQHPGLYERIRYRPVELNPVRRSELHRHLETGNHSGKIDSADARPVIGCVLANEFLDALPVRRITQQNGELCEAMVTWRDGWFAEHVQPVRDHEITEYLDRHSLSLEEGEWVEIQTGVAEWLDEVGRTLERGFALVIDYGYPADELFSAHRREGTVKAYYRHGVSTEFFRGVGEQDLTAHVNFSEVEHLARERGLESLAITTQAEMLSALGVGERLVKIQQQPELTADDYLAVRAAVLRMIDPGAMGRFRALYLKKGVDEARRPVGVGPTAT